MAKFTDEDDALLEELGVEVETKRASSRTAREERIIAGFEEIQRFIEEHGRAPMHGEDRDIFERLYAVRLDRMRELDECRTLVEPLDHQGLLSGGESATASNLDELDDEALLAELGVETQSADITELRHVRSSAEKRAAEEIANRERCEDFEKFKPLFEKVQQELKDGIRKTRPFELKSEIVPGSFFIVSGQKAFVAQMGEVYSNAQGRTDARLRVIFDNGTESNMLMRSLQRALHKDDAGRRITDPTAGPLFSDENSEDDQASGTIYVLRSKSDHPMVAENRKLIHKIGVTGGKVETRVSNAKFDATYLLADVEIVATYNLFNINRAKLEALLHRFFAGARFDIEIEDRFGKKVKPREWYLLPLSVIDEAVGAIQNGTIEKFSYSPDLAKLVRHDE